MRSSFRAAASAFIKAAGVTSLPPLLGNGFVLLGGRGAVPSLSKQTQLFNEPPSGVGHAPGKATAPLGLTQPRRLPL